ncbi:sortilin-related receptor-like [Phthorimaea operculella]|nr:sortilin-related receptor-like [Phthorimaea operculella]
MVCNGHQDCYDGTDEVNCTSDSTSQLVNTYYKVSHLLQSEYTLFIVDGTLCLSQAMVCNGHQDCYDGTDEVNCTSDSTSQLVNTYYKLISIGVDQLSINSSSFLISCWMPQQKTVQYSFLPSIAKVADGVWKNMTWTNDTVYRFTDLEPFTNYNVTFYIRDSLSKKIYAANKYVNTTTGEGVPSPPGRVTVRQLIGSRVDVLWDPPTNPRGLIKSYTIYYTPPVPPNVKVVPVTWHPPANRSLSYRSTVTGYFEPKTKYAFWVTAQNSAHTSESSEVAEIIFEDIGDVDDLANVSMARLNQTAVYLEWHKIRGIEGYLVSLTYPRNYEQPPSINTTSTNITYDVANVIMARFNQTAVYLEWHKIRGIEGYLVSLTYPRNYEQPPSVNTTSTNITSTDDVDDVANVIMARFNQTAVYLEWHKIRGIEGYLVSLTYPRNYEQPPSVNTTSTNITCKYDLCG